MIEKDTIRLLRECDAGVKMGIESIDDVRESVRDENFRNLMITCKREHESLEREIRQELARFSDEGKEPSPIAEAMSKLKTEFKIRMKEEDSTIAELMTDGCNMGVKSLHKYLNQYTAAEDKAKDITQRLINLEEKLAVDIRSYL